MWRVYLEICGIYGVSIRCRALIWVYGLFVGWEGLEYILEEHKLAGVLILWFWCTIIVIEMRTGFTDTLAEIRNLVSATASGEQSLFGSLAHTDALLITTSVTIYFTTQIKQPLFIQFIL